MNIITQEQIQQITSLSQIFIKSWALPKWLDNEAKVTMVLMAWRDLWLNPTQAINWLYIVNGKITVYGETAIMLIKRAWYEIDILESTAKKATVRISKWEKYQECTYTIEEADHAGITSGGMWIWKKYPRQMLMYKAIAFARKFFCPDVLWWYLMKEEIDEKETISKDEEKDIIDGFTS